MIDLPEDFKWPEEVFDQYLEEDPMPQMEIALNHGGADPGFFPGGNAFNRASHNLPDTEINVRPMDVPGDPDQKQFSMQNPEESEGTWTVEVFPGWVYSISPKKGHAATAGVDDCIDRVMPEIGGQKLNVKVAGEYPKLTVAAGDTVCLRIERDEQGDIVEPVEVMVRPPADDSKHYVPDILPDHPGEDEQYQYWDVFRVDSENSKIVPYPKWQDDVLLTPFLWKGENLGGGEKVLKKFEKTTDFYQFRTLVEEWGHTITTNGDTIEHELNEINFGDDGAGGSDPGTVGEPILLSKTESAAQNKDLVAILRRIAEGDVSDRRQITIKKADGAIHIMGNDVDGSITYDDSTASPPTTGNILISVEDGLVTEINGDLEVFEADFCIPGVSGNPPTIETKKILTIS